MKQKQSFPKEDFLKRLKRDDNSSKNITIRISPQTDENINRLKKYIPISPFRIMAKQLLDVFLETNDFNEKNIMAINKLRTLKTRKSEIKSKDIKLLSLVVRTTDLDRDAVVNKLISLFTDTQNKIQKTYAISSTTNGVLTDIAKYLGLTKGMVFELMVLHDYNVFIGNKYEEAKTNLETYRKIMPLLEELCDTYNKNHEKIISLLEESHIPPYNELYPEAQVGSDYDDNYIKHIEVLLGNLDVAMGSYIGFGYDALRKAISEYEEFLSKLESENEGGQ